MPTADDIPHLLSLLNDSSQVVRNEVRRALADFGKDLPKLLQREEVGPRQRALIFEVMESVRRDLLIQRWPKYRAQLKFADQLEYGLDCIARYHTGVLHPETLKEMLDQLAGNFRERHNITEGALALSRYLFQEVGLVGDRKNYYNPQNSNLIQVLKSGTGNPISLTCVYILTAARLGFTVEGCNFPGHFLARVKRGEEVLFVDCFGGGRVLDENLSELLRGSIPAPQRAEALLKPASAEVILTRVIRNLLNSYRQRGEVGQGDLFLYLLKSVAVASLSGRVPDFQPGNLVEHRRYKYRGVVVDYDLECSADEAWYRSNRTQPDKDQPWYKVLVDGTNRITYAAQSSLKSDTKLVEIEHPLLALFFTSFEQGVYIRNERPWPTS